MFDIALLAWSPDSSSLVFQSSSPRRRRRTKPRCSGDDITKGEVINYYPRIAPLLLPQLAGRPVTFIRYPDGVEGESWFEKNLPRGAPSWLRTAQLSSTGSRSGRGPGTISHPLIDDVPSLVWAATMAALELQPPQWTVDADGQRQLPDRLVERFARGEIDQDEYERRRAALRR